MPYTDDYTDTGGYSDQQDTSDPAREKVKSPWGEEFDPLDPGFLQPKTAPDGSVYQFNAKTLQWDLVSGPTKEEEKKEEEKKEGPTKQTPAPYTGEDLTAKYTKEFTPPPVRFPGATGTGVPETPQFTPPGYTPPPAFDYADFRAPTAEDVLNDPGYQFARDEGERALKAGYAAGGVLNTGGTMKDILAWGGNYANQRYGDVLNRNLNIYGTNRAGAVQKYNTNYQTRYQDPYAIAYQGAQASFDPQMVGYSTQASANQRQNELDYERSRYDYDEDYRRFRDWQDATFSKRFQTATA